jgi:hypothetical protein
MVPLLFPFIPRCTLAYFGGFMATKALTQEDFEEAEFIQTQKAEDVTALQNDIDDQINSIFSEVGADKNEVNYYFQVWRVLKDQADMAFLFKGTPAELPIMERLRDEYDGGRFHIQIYRNKKRYKRLNVTVEMPKKAAIATMVKNDMAEVLKEMGRQQQENFNMLKDTVMQMVGKPSTPQPSQMEMMTGMMTLMMSMKNFVSPPAQSNVSPDKMIEVLIKGMELGRESGGGGETGLMDIAKELIKSPLLGSLAQAVNNPPQLPRPAMQPQIPMQSKPGTIPAQPQMTTQAQAQAQPKPQGTNMTNPVIKHYLNQLIQKAEKDSDPVLYAEFILDNVPQSMVEENIMREDLIEYLSSIDPRVSNYKEWFIELRDHIISVLTIPDEQEDNEGNSDISGDTDPNATGSPDNSTDDTVRPIGDTPDA